MDLLALVFYGAVNALILVFHLKGEGRMYRFPFWISAISMGWLFPQAVGGYLNVAQYPEGAYASGMFFASICTLVLWASFSWAAGRPIRPNSWLAAPFLLNRLFLAGAMLCAIGFFFQWKLMTLPVEVRAMTQWTGAAVKYLFLASIFRFGFVTLWLLYLSQPRIWVPKIWIFLGPGFLLMFQAIVLHGRRAAMMEMVSYMFVTLWLVRRVAIPRWVLVSGLSMGLVLINAIGAYRSIMGREDATLLEKFSAASKVDYASSTSKVLDEGGAEFKNYIFYRHVYAGHAQYDFGLTHWNGFVFNFIPAQIIGRGLKNALMVPIFDPAEDAQLEYGHNFRTGTTVTGFCDAFGSFGWFGFIKFMWVGVMMGTLYRYAMKRYFLGQLLYIFTLGTAMHIVSHGTHKILVSIWVYFFALCFPILFWAKAKRPRESSPSVNESCMG